MDRIKIVVVALTLISGCASPSVQFSGIAPIPITVAGMTFKVYANGPNVQVIRTSRGAPDEAPFRSIVSQVIEMATGCSVVPESLDGDFNLVNGSIVC